jgi:hypothetical protein
VETERYREILGKELRVTDRQMKEQAIQKLKEFEEQRKNGPTELEAAMRYVRSQTNHSIRHTLGAIHVRAYAGRFSQCNQPQLTHAGCSWTVQEAESEQKVPSNLSQRDRRGLQPGMG